MLVVPALLSLKPFIMDQQSKHMLDLVRGVLKRIKHDQSEIVAKTGKKLILELNKCYPSIFKLNYADALQDK